jgi:hypothetical protein
MDALDIVSNNLQTIASLPRIDANHNILLRVKRELVRLYQTAAYHSTLVCVPNQPLAFLVCIVS